MDRASRYTEDFARLIRLSEDQGWRLIVSEMGIDTRTPMDNQAGGIGHITSTSYACNSNVYDVQSEKLLSRIWSASSRRAHLTALAERGTPVEDQATAIFARSRGHCSDRAVKRFVQD